MQKIIREKGTLKYVLENCIFAYDELWKINKELVESVNCSNSKANVNHLGAMNRMIQDYLIIRVGGLFDRMEYRVNGGDDEVTSFEKLFSGNESYKSIKKQEMMKYIINQRHNFVAHININHIENKFPKTAKICNSNLRILLENLLQLLYT